MGDERLSKKREIANWPQEKKKKKLLLISLNVPVHIHMGSTQNYSDQNKDVIQINTCLRVCCDVG